jgi:hypothetical protein
MVLFFDPGPSTGVAVIDGDEVLHTEVIRNLDDERFEVLAVTLRERYVELCGARVGIEAPPMWTGNMRPVTQAYESILRRLFPDAEWINPGQWKSTPSARSKVPVGLTQHERDAVRAARWLQSRGLSSARSGSA